MVLAQLNGIDVLSHFRLAGLFLNPNFLGEISALVLIGLIAERLWLFTPVPLACLAITHPRGALLAFIVSFVFYIWKRSRVIALALIAMGIVAIGAMWKSDYRIAPVEQRFYIWADAYDGLKGRGQGIGSFRASFPEKSTRFDNYTAKADHAHNDALELLFQYGIGAIPILILALLLLTVPMETARLMWLVFLVEGLFEFPLFLPAQGFLAAFAAGSLAYGWVHLRQHNIARRSILPAVGQRHAERSEHGNGLHAKGRFSRA